MAITIIREPVNYSPCSNQMTYVFKSDLSALSTFKYKIELYIEDSLEDTANLYPRPIDEYGNIGTCIYDPSFILKQYVNNKIDNNLTGATGAFNFETFDYKLKITDTYIANQSTLRFFDNEYSNVFPGKLGLKVDLETYNALTVDDVIIIEQDDNTLNPTYDGETTIIGKTGANGGYYHIVVNKDFGVATNVIGGYIYVNPTISILSGSTKTTWNAVADWEEAKDLEEFTNKFILTTSTTTTPLLLGPKRFQTDALNYVNANDIFTNVGNLIDIKNSYQISSTDKRVVSFFIEGLTGATIPDSIFIITTPKTGYSQKIFMKSFTSTKPILHFPVGMTELNKISWTIDGGTITETEDAGYYVFIANSSATLKITHQPIHFNLNNCARFDDYTVMYKSENGAWWYNKFNMKSTKTLDVNFLNYEKYLPYNYGDSDSVTTTYNTQSQGKYILRTDWLQTQEAVDEIVDMLNSPMKFLLINGKTIPVIVPNGGFEIKQKAQDKMISYEISFIEAFIKNTL